MRCIAIIPARGGSKGIPRKNLRPIGGIPLIVRTVRAALEAHRVEDVYVSTDDAEIASVAEAAGAKVIHRPAEISGDTASSESALLHGLDHLTANGIEPETLVFLQCTSPFTTGEEIDLCVEALRREAASVAFSVIEDHGFLWRVTADGAAQGINHDEKRPRQRRQDLAPQYRETGSIYALRTRNFRAVGQRFCGRAVLVPIDAPLVEIDSEDDFRLLHALAAGRQPAGAAPRGIRALVMDFDGVLTDDRVLVTDEGHEAVLCSRGDGLGLEALRRAGFKLLILSKERNPVVSARGTKLQIEVLQGIEDKLGALGAWLGNQGLTWQEVAYMGNDVNDLACMQAAAWAIAPADAHVRAKECAGFVTARGGGVGAVREVCELFLEQLAIGKG